MVLGALRSSKSFLRGLYLVGRPNIFYVHLRCYTTPLGNTSWSFSHDSLANIVNREFILQDNFVSVDEESSLVGELETYLQKHKYQSDHWDYAIKNYRETERKTWNSVNRPVIHRLRELTCLALDSSPPSMSSPTDRLALPMIHVLDVAESGEIMPHVDSVRYCGDCVAVISLLSDSILRLSIAPPDQVVGWPIELTSYLHELKLPRHCPSMECDGPGMRSFVRPISPLSRLQQQQQQQSSRDQDRLHRHRRRESGRSRSPVEHHRTLASTVHRASRREPYGEEDDVERRADAGFDADQPSGGVETRRVIVVQRSGQDGSEMSEVVFERSLDQPQVPLETHTPDMPALPDGKRCRVNSQHVAPSQERRTVNGRSQRKSIALSVDRKSMCPILVRLAISSSGKHHCLSEFDRGRFPEGGIQVHTWIDCSLKELAEEVRFSCPSARRRGSRLHFAIVYPDQRGRFRRRDIGVVITGFVNRQQQSFVPVDQQAQHQMQPLDGGRRTADKGNFNLTDDSTVTLIEKRFHIGDYIDVAISQHMAGSLGGYANGRQPIGPVTSARPAGNLI